MFYRRFASLICIFVAAAIATVNNHTHSVTGSKLEATVYPSTTENQESSRREPDQQNKETSAVDLGALLDAGDGTIVTLVAGGTSLVVHRAVLAARSPVFSAMLERITLEASAGQVAVSDIEGPVLRQLLAYMYTLQAPQLPSMASQLLAAADTYGLSSLKEHCEQQVAAQLSVETAAATAVLAVKHSSDSLRKAAVTFIKRHIFRVMATRGWADAMKNQPGDLMKVMTLLSDTPAETSVPATGGSGTAPTTQPCSDHSGHSSQTPASAVKPTTSISTFPPDDTVSRFRAPSTEGSATTGPATWPHSGHGHQTPASPALPTAPCSCSAPVDHTVSRLPSLSAQEKNRRLIEAAKDGAVQEVEALLAAGADVGAGDEDRWTALHWAARRGHVEVARSLLAAGAAVEARGSKVESTPLHWAAYSGHAAVVRLLVEEASADPNARDARGWTPLYWAAFGGKAEAAAALLQAGADKGATDSVGLTPLDLARNYRYQELIDILI